jgi:hypothetical protein
MKYNSLIGRDAADMKNWEMPFRTKYQIVENKRNVDETETCQNDNKGKTKNH